MDVTTYIAGRMWSHSLKRRYRSGLCGVISRKAAIFLVTSVRSAIVSANSSDTHPCQRTEQVIRSRENHFRRGHGCLSRANVVPCQIQVSRNGWSLVQTRPTECVCVCVCVGGMGVRAPLHAIRPNNNPLHLKWVATRGKTKKRERNVMKIISLTAFELCISLQTKKSL